MKKFKIGDHIWVPAVVTDIRSGEVLFEHADVDDRSLRSRRFDPDALRKAFMKEHYGYYGGAGALKVHQELIPDCKICELLWPGRKK